MKTSMCKFVFPLCLALVAVAGSLACRQTASQASNDRSGRAVFERIRLGMPRVEVERAAGRPVSQFANRAYYGEVPRGAPAQSANMPHSTVILYSTNNVVAYKAFYDGTNMVMEGDVPRVVR